MPTLTKVVPKSEKELHGIIEKEIDALEEGLEVLKYEFAFRKGIADFLCVDSGGQLVVIEVKLKEDENILFQALRYYNEIDKERYAIAQIFSNKKVNPEENPRILLIAERFSDNIKQLSTLVVPDVELYEYTVLSTPDGQQGIYFHPMPLPPPPPPTTTSPKTPEELRNYITEDSLKPLFDRLRDEIKGIGKGIEEYTTQRYVGFKYRGKQLAALFPHRKVFDIGVAIIGEDSHVLNYEVTRIESNTDDYIENIEKIKTSFSRRGGKVGGEGDSEIASSR